MSFHLTLLWFFKTDEFKKQISGGENTMINQVTRYMLDEIKIPLPPLPEQQRIVSILDEAFAAIAKSKAIAEQNLQNAKELFESYLQGVFEKKGDGWEEKKLGEVTNIQRGSSPRPKGDPRYFSARETEFNWITISDISSFCEDNVLLRTREWLTEEGSKQSRFVDENEFIIAVSGSTTGKCCITGIKGFIYDGLAVVKVKKNILDPIFLLNYMMSLYSTINNSKAGAAFPNINTNYLNNLPISFPPLQAQQTIVRQLDALRAEAQKLEAVYQKKIDDLEELKKSILQKAFAGELRSPEGAEYKSEVATPLADKKPNTITSPEGV
ncbi:MAG: restriction endonuclease subunit S [Sphingobacteriales bacterium]|nr:restriction endonuclease subunit S [Sphingobacteriales bacterium]